ncbi:MAG TPA: GNAT family N-acetyltransferase [Ktedonobacterales bacterium]|nr:GNAT family N-acetyltransferase [Ktedonobacterales bacterium]
MAADFSLPPPAELAVIFDQVRTERLALRRLRSEDGPAMFAVHGDPATNVYNPAGPDPNLAASEEKLRSMMGHWDAYGFGYWAVTLPGAENVLALVASNSGSGVSERY